MRDECVAFTRVHDSIAGLRSPENSGNKLLSKPMTLVRVAYSFSCYERLKALEQSSKYTEEGVQARICNPSNNIRRIAEVSNPELFV